MHIAGVVEAFGSTPEKFDRGIGFHLFCYVIGDLVKLCVCLRKSAVLGGKVAVVETEVINGKFIHYLKSCVNLSLCSCCGVRLSPCLVSSAAAEHIRAVAAHCVPPGKGKFELLAHSFAGNHLVRVVVLERQRVGAVLALKGDLADVFEKFAHFSFLLDINFKPHGRKYIQLLYLHYTL